MSTITSHGYVLVYVGKAHHLANVNGYAYEHRLIAEQSLGRHLEQGELVHHINSDRTDNRPSNLEVLRGNSNHFVLHRGPKSKRRLPGEANPVVTCACGCGKTFPFYDDYGRPREMCAGHKNPETIQALCACGCGRHVKHHLNRYLAGHAPNSSGCRSEEPNDSISCECGCGTTFPRFDAYNRRRRFVSGHNQQRGNVS